ARLWLRIAAMRGGLPAGDTRSIHDPRLLSAPNNSRHWWRPVGAMGLLGAMGLQGDHPLKCCAELLFPTRHRGAQARRVAGAEFLIAWRCAARWHCQRNDIVLNFVRLPSLAVPLVGAVRVAPFCIDGMGLQPLVPGRTDTHKYLGVGFMEQGDKVAVQIHGP